MNIWLKLNEKDLQLSAVVVVTLFFQGKRSRRDLKFFTSVAVLLLLLKLLSSAPNSGFSFALKLVSCCPSDFPLLSKLLFSALLLPFLIFLFALKTALGSQTALLCLLTAASDFDLLSLCSNCSSTLSCSSVAVLFSSALKLLSSSLLLLSFWPPVTWSFQVFLHKNLLYGCFT